jgi:hypothetical protein
MDLTPNSIWRKFINDEFMLDRYYDFRNWFFKKFPSWEREKIKDDYYNHLMQTQNYIRFVEWFITYFVERSDNEILTLKSRPWYITGEKDPIHTPFPPEKISF